MLEAVDKDAVVVGLLRAEAQLMAAIIRGAAGVVLIGQRPALLRVVFSTPGWCMIEVLLVLEERRVKRMVAMGLREAMTFTRQVAIGVKGG